MFGVIITETEEIILRSNGAVSILAWLEENKRENSFGFFIIPELNMITPIWGD